MIRQKSGFTLVELLVVLAIIGVLVGLLLPGVQAAREAARATQCKNHLHQISLATDLFHNTYGCFPPARYQSRPGEPLEHSCGGEETTWLVRILPFIEQSSRHDQWDFTKTYASHPEEIRTSSISEYCCPTRRSLDRSIGRGTGGGFTVIRLGCGCEIRVPIPGGATVEGAVGDYGGNHGDLSPGSFGLPTDFYFGGNGTGVIISSRPFCNSGTPVNWADRLSKKDLLDGTAFTILTGEMHVPVGKLGQAPLDAFIFSGDEFFSSTRIGGPTVPIVQDIRSEGNGLVSWGSWHRGICHFAMSDGSTRSLSTSIDTETLGNLCNRYDGNVTEIGP